MSLTINKITWFSRSLLYSDLYASLIVFVLYGTNNILRAIVLLFCSNFFQFFCSVGISILFQLYWLIKGSFFDIPCKSLTIFWWFNATVMAYWKQLSSFSFCGFIVAFYFSTIRETLCMIHLFSWLFYENNNTINQHFHE